MDAAAIELPEATLISEVSRCSRLTVNSPRVGSTARC